MAEAARPGRLRWPQPTAARPPASRALTADERAHVLALLTSERFVDAKGQILADVGVEECMGRAYSRIVLLNGSYFGDRLGPRSIGEIVGRI